MSKILIKRGLQENIANLVLVEGEMAVALDTGNLYVGTTAGTTHINPKAIDADKAVALKNAREFSITGDGTAAAVSFNGTQNVVLELSLATMTGLAAGTYTKLTVDKKGRVTGATQITLEDLPSIPASKVTGLGTAAKLNTGTASGNVVVVGSNGKISESVLPALAISETFEAASQSAMLALTAQRGDICIRSDLNKSFILKDSPASTLANWKELLTPTDAVLSVNGKKGAVTLNATDVGAEAAFSGTDAKTTLVDNDQLIARDSTASNVTKRITFQNLKAALKSYFDGLYNKYTHPVHTAHVAGLYKITVDTQGHVTAASAVSKTDITALGIPAKDTVYSLPMASATTLGGVKVGAGLAISSGVLSVGDIDGGTF